MVFKFPRPLVTFLYLQLYFYFLICFCFTQKKKFIYFIAIILFLLANSFFYLFISSGLLFFFLLIILHFKKNFFYAKKKVITISYSIAIVLAGLFIILLQNYFGELDYSRRIGLIEINLNQKIFLFKYFIKSLVRFEILLLIVIILILNLISKKIIFKKTVLNILNIFFYFFVTSIVSPFIFVFLSSKVISLYHFFDCIIFSGIFYILLNLLILFYYKYFLINKKFAYLFFFLCCFMIFLHHKPKTDIAEERNDLNLINNFLLKNNFTKSDKVLFTNDLRILNLWLYHKNKYLAFPEGFSNSLKDSQIEVSLFSAFKALDVNSNQFKEFLKLKVKNDGRDFFSLFLFNYKYQANSLTNFSNIKNYFPNEQDKIQNVSPLRSRSIFIPDHEKKRILNNYQNFKNKKYYPDVVIIDKGLFINFQPKQYIKVFDNKNYLIYFKK